MTQAEALKAAKEMFGAMAWVSSHHNENGTSYTVASDPKCRVRVTSRSWEEALIIAEEKLIELQKREPS